MRIKRQSDQEVLDEMGRRMRANPAGRGLDEASGDPNGPKLQGVAANGEPNVKPDDQQTAAVESSEPCSDGAIGRHSPLPVENRDSGITLLPPPVAALVGEVQAALARYDAALRDFCHHRWGIPSIVERIEAEFVLAANALRDSLLASSSPREEEKRLHERRGNALRRALDAAFATANAATACDDCCTDLVALRDYLGKVIIDDEAGALFPAPTGGTT